MTATASRAQHLIPAVAVLLLSLTVVWLSFTREPAAAFLFPRLIASVMFLLAVWNCVRAALGLARVGAGLELEECLRIAPGVLVVLVYVLFVARWLGFYTASLGTFIVLYSLYDPASHFKLTTWLHRIAISLIFMAVIYGLFAVLLKVQTPRGLYF